MSDPDLIVTLAWSTGLLFVTSIGFAVAWVRARERALRARLDRVTPAEPDIVAASARVAHLTDAVDAIALEVERIAEAQRFAARLLAERESASRQPSLEARPSSPPRVITPH